LSNARLNQRDQLFMEFGILIQPYVELANSNTPPTLEDYRLAIAKAKAGDPEWRKTVKRYCTLASDVFMGDEFQKVSHVPEHFAHKLRESLEKFQGDLDALKTEFVSELEKFQGEFQDQLNRVPLKWEQEIFEANTPFTAYLRIRQTLETATQRVDYFDRYLKLDFFHLYLPLLDRQITVHLITTPGNTQYGVQGMSQVSELARQEFDNYKLIEVQPEDMHDRNLRVDDQVFSLGPGVSGAGNAPTNFGPGDSSVEGHSRLDKVILDGRVVHE